MTARIIPATGARTVVCRNHCSVCGRHFSSTKAFDQHLTHDEDRWPRCLDPSRDDECMDRRTGESKFGALAVDGECRMYPPNVERPVVVWALVGSVEAAREQWGRGRAPGVPTKCPEPLEAPGGSQARVAASGGAKPTSGEEAA